MLLAATLAIWMEPTHHKISPSPLISLEKTIPFTLPNWKAEVLPATNQIKSTPPSEQLYDQVFSRTYTNQQHHHILLLIAYGSRQTHELKAHRQEICYTAQGFKIYNLKTTDIQLAGRTVPVTRMLAVKPDREEHVTYWFTMSSKIVLGHLERLVRQLKFAMMGTIPDGFLFRISSINQNESDAIHDQTEFLNELMHAMDQNTVTRLIGIK